MLGFHQALLLLHGFVALASKDADSGVSAASPRCSPDHFQPPQIGRGVTILSIHAQPQHDFTSSPGGPWQPPVSGLNFCQVQVYLAHEGQLPFRASKAKDKVLVEVWLPLTQQDWNGRLQATGGAGFATGMFGAHLGVAVKNGWAAVSTDGGHDANLMKLSDASWALQDGEKRASGEDKRQMRWELLHNWASRSAVDQILVAKSITEQYFGKKPHHSYWNGCSTGGRQGFAIAQKHPELVDGILAAAPAFNFVNLLMGELWPTVVMNTAKTYLSNCEFDYFRNRATESCEMQEDVKDGILDDPSSCTWDPLVLVGEKFECDGHKVTVTQQMAQVVQAIHDGPGGSSYHNKFPGLAWGVSMSSLANITIAKDGTRSPNPFSIATGWLRSVAFQGQPISIPDLDEKSLDAAWVSVEAEFGSLLNTDDPDLSRLRDSGTKLLSWHGINDQLIPFQNSINYRKQVEAIMNGPYEVDEFYRLFLAPGVDHCGEGIGPIPKDPLEALTRWVEHNEPPRTLDAEMLDHEGDLVTRDLCRWPLKSKYVGIGDTKRASTWNCLDDIEETLEPSMRSLTPSKIWPTRSRPLSFLSCFPVSSLPLDTTCCDPSIAS